MAPHILASSCVLAVLAEWAVVAQTPSGGDWVGIVTQTGFAGILIWMLIQQKEERIADRERQAKDRAVHEKLVEAIEMQRQSIDQQTHAMLVLTLSVSVNPNAASAAKEILRDRGDNTPR